MGMPNSFRNLTLVAAIILFLYPIGSVSAVELSRDEQEYLRFKGTIVFVSQTRYPPFEFVDKNREHTGMCIELARWIATELGFNACFMNTSFQNAQDAILSGEANAIIGDELIVLYHVFKNGFSDRIKKVGEPLYIGQNCVAARELIKIRPDIPIIICTGFSEKISKQKARDIGIRELVMRPLVMRELAETIKRVL